MDGDGDGAGMILCVFVWFGEFEKLGLFGIQRN